MTGSSAVHNLDDQQRDVVAALARGKSFADLGALWAVPNIAVPAAALAGARAITVIDPTPLGDEPWRDFDRAMAAAHAQGYSRIWADLVSPGAAGRLGCFDVTHCAGLVSRSVSPVALLMNLREMTRETAIISSLAVPVEAGAGSGAGDGQMELNGGRMLALFGLGSIEELLVAEFLETHVPGRWRLPEAADAHASGVVAADGLSPWFWLFGRESLERQIRAAGFEIERILEQGPHVSFVCHPQGSPVRMNTAPETAASSSAGTLETPQAAVPPPASPAPLFSTSFGGTRAPPAPVSSPPSISMQTLPAQTLPTQTLPTPVAPLAAQPGSAPANSADHVMAVALASAASDMATWASGIAHEAFFWREFVQTGGLQWPQEFDERTQLERPVSWVFEELIQDIGREKIRILDAGAGPFTSVGSTSNFADLDVVAVDPLAPVYDRILGVRAITPPVRTQYAPVEALSLFSRGALFDIVHVRNALDHSFNPLLGILQMIACTARGGVIYLSHHENEALRANYTDFHQFNFEVKDGRFFIWNRSHRIDVGEWLDGFAHVETLDGGLGADVKIYPAPVAAMPALDEKQDAELWFHIQALVEDAMKTFDFSPSQTTS